MSLSKQAPLPAWGYALSGAAGAVLANTIVYPLDIIKTKLQVQKIPIRADVEKGAGERGDDDYYEDTADAFLKIYRKHGLFALYNGLPGALLGVASTNFAYFYWYGFLRSSYQRKITNISTVMELIIGAAAGALAQIFTIPVSVVTTRQQTSDDVSGLLQTGREVIGEDGITGLWRGLKASLVLVVNPAITYGMYQRFRELIFKNKVHLSAYDSFFLGALSKAMATIVSQPLIVSKVMLQSKPKSGEPRHKSFVDALIYLAKYEGIRGLFKGIGPQISKGILVQGLLFMFKDQLELLIILLFRFLRASQKRFILMK
ncbi:mitochondrial carrier domain-containing protein [Lipomyces orientalis]|uniref:Mitochondrial carrier domain-containing protein n=1 Tax=Lipomyces orientalis TaxID=1233043 RepID=A0ACC3TX68_9ASCO